MKWIRATMVGVLAAICAGVVVGALSRLLMRAVTLAADHAGSFSWVDSMGVLIIYSVAMIPGGIAAAATRRPIRWVLAGGGAAFLLVPAIGIASEEIGETNVLSPLRWLVLGATSLGVFATIVVLLPSATVKIADRLVGRTKERQPFVPSAT
jgi:hypothetical protein